MELKKLSVDEVRPNPYQPREKFDEKKLNELSDNIKAHGMIEPIVVTPKDGKYMIVAGERRWRASKKAGIEKIHAIVKNYETETDIKRDSLVENEIRENLTNKEFYDFCESLAKSLGKEYYNKEDGINQLRLVYHIFGVSYDDNRSKYQQDSGHITRTYFYTRLNDLKKVYNKGSEELKKAVENKEISLKNADKIASVHDFETQNELLEMAKEKDFQGMKEELEKHRIETDYQVWKGDAKVSDEKKKKLVNEEYLVAKLETRLIDWYDNLVNFNAVLKTDKKFIKSFNEESRLRILDKMKPIKKELDTLTQLIESSMEQISEGV